MTKKTDPHYNTGSLPDDAEYRPQDPTPSIDSNDEPLPPAYSGPSTSQNASSASLTRLHVIPGLPSLPFANYAPKGSSISKDLSTIHISDPDFTFSLNNFTKVLNQQTSLPPRPALRITGTHQKWGNSEVDFDFRLDMMRYFVPKDGDIALNFVRIANKDANGSQQSLQDYAKAYLLDKTRPKRFTISRLMSNWDTEYLSGCIHTLVASLNYRGQIKVDFPATHTTVIVDTEAKSIASTFRSLFVEPKDYRIEAVWPYATTPPGGADTRDVPRRSLVRSEEGWWNDWKAVILDAILSKRVDRWIGLEDWIEVSIMPTKSQKQPAPWGMDT